MRSFNGPDFVLSRGPPLERRRLCPGIHPTEIYARCPYEKEGYGDARNVYDRFCYKVDSLCRASSRDLQRRGREEGAPLKERLSWPLV